MSQENILDYLRKTPHNTNVNVVKGMINNTGNFLPEVTEVDNGKVLTVVDGQWEKAEGSSGNAGYSCSTEYITIEERTTSEDSWNMDYYNYIDASKVRVTLNGVEYEADITPQGDYNTYGALWSDDGYNYSVYPFVIESYEGGSNCFTTNLTNEYTVKIETYEDVIEITNCFEKAVQSISGFKCSQSKTQITEEQTTSEGYVSLNFFSDAPQLYDYTKLIVSIDEVEYIANGNGNTFIFEGGQIFYDEGYGSIELESGGEHQVIVYVPSLVAETTKCFDIAVESVEKVHNAIDNIITYLKDGSTYGSIRSVNSEEVQGSYWMGSDAVAIGYKTKASGNYSHAEGNSTEASGHSSHAEGDNTKATQLSSHAEGYSTTAGGSNSHSEGNGTIASGDHSHSEGGGTTASGINSHAEGSGTQASGGNSHAEGLNSKAIGSCSHAEGVSSKATGDYSHVEGGSGEASGNYSHSEGGSTTASGNYSHSEGSNTQASGVSSHAEGGSTQAGGSDSHAEGSSTKASGDYSHAEGYACKAVGDYSHAEGGINIANGEYSSVTGFQNQSTHKCQHIFGEYNILDTSIETSDKRGTYVEIVGNGHPSVRSNARTLDWSGNERLAGSITLGVGTADEVTVTAAQLKALLALLN